MSSAVTPPWESDKMDDRPTTPPLYIHSLFLILSVRRPFTLPVGTHTHQCRLHLRSPSIQLTELWNFVGCGAPWPASTRSQTGAFIGRWPPIFRFWLIQTACSVGIWCGSLFTPPPSFAFIRRAANPLLALRFLFALHFAALWLVAVYCPPELSIKRQHNFFSTQANYGKEENQWDIVVLCSADDKKSKSVNLVEATNDQIGSGKPVRQ